MALMTSCPACVTRFKVVPDQLRLHHGLVRCGACDHVFDANKRLETLPENLEGTDIRYSQGARKSLDQTHQSPSEQSWIHKPAVQALANAPNNPVQQGGHNPGEQVNAPHTAILDTGIGRAIVNDAQNNDGQWMLPRKQDTVFESPEGLNFSVQDSQSQNQTAAYFEKNHQLSAQAPQPSATPTRPLPRISAKRPDNRVDTEVAAHSPQQQQTMQFILQLIGVLALVFLLIQLLLLGRFYLVDKVQALKAPLTGLCRPFGCSVEPAKWLHPLHLDALTLVRAPSVSVQTPSQLAFRLQATVRNASNLAVLKPRIELSISNSQGQLLARKTLDAVKLLAVSMVKPNSEPNPLTIDANRDWLIDSMLLLDEETVGYTARLVYD